MIECPHCAGEGGRIDYWGEFSECWCCDGEGKVSPERLATFNAETAAIDAAIDAEIERQMRGEGLQESC